jgi:uncharacterized protein (TIGR02466 family)
MEINPIFPEPIGIYKSNIEGKKILNFLKKTKFKNTYATLDNESSSRFSLDFKILDKLPDLKKNILLHAEHFIKNVLEYDVNFKINSSWATEVIPKGFSQKHSHAHSFISGVYYPEYDKNFKISFYKKNHNPFWSLNVKKWNIYNSKKWTFMPNKNSIFLFLSDLEHEIVKNTSNKNRYSIAFNIIPIGQLGYEDIDLFIK